MQRQRERSLRGWRLGEHPEQNADGRRQPDQRHLSAAHLGGAGEPRQRRDQRAGGEDQQHDVQVLQRLVCAERRDLMTRDRVEPARQTLCLALKCGVAELQGHLVERLLAEAAPAAVKLSAYHGWKTDTASDAAPRAAIRDPVSGPSSSMASWIGLPTL